MFALRHAREIGLETQVQTTVTRRNLSKLAQIAEQVGEAQAKMWSLFFLVAQPVEPKKKISRATNTKRSSSFCMRSRKSRRST